jgi:predicted MFS family arabinose efflux permease
MVPFARARLGIGDGTLGLLLLCIGIGSLVIMPMTGGLVGRLGSRLVILVSGLGFCLALPVLAMSSHLALVALALLLFGASLGAMDVAMNIHAVEVERGSPTPLMSGFHGLFSVGGFTGAGSMTALLAFGLPLAVSAAAAVLVVVATLAIASPRFLSTHIGRSDPFLVRPRGLVLVLGTLAFVAFLVEGAVLDWSALLLTRHHGVAAAYGGVGYVAFSLAMTTGRLAGDRIVAGLGRRRVMVVGGLLTTAGLLATLVDGQPLLALGGFVMVGLGASNIVPVLFSEAGRQQVMPAGLAIAAMTTVGYAGILVGPAAIGFVAAASSLPAAHALLAGLMLAVPLSARALRGESGGR